MPLTQAGACSFAKQLQIRMPHRKKISRELKGINHEPNQIPFFHIDKTCVIEEMELWGLGLTMLLLGQRRLNSSSAFPFRNSVYNNPELTKVKIAKVTKYVFAIIALFSCEFGILRARAEQSIGTSIREVFGPEHFGIQPFIIASPSGSSWSISVGFFGRTNYVRDTWLRLQSDVGGQVSLTSENGAHAVPKDNVVSVSSLPKKIKIPEYMKSVPRRRRGLQWISILDGKGPITTVFALTNAFDVDLTQNYTIRIKPLLYRAVNAKTANLVEFPSIEIALPSLEARP